MKKPILFALVFAFANCLLAQTPKAAGSFVSVPKHIANKGAQLRMGDVRKPEAALPAKPQNPATKAKQTKSFDEVVIGRTVYDIQTHASMPQRAIYNGNNSISLIYMQTDSAGSGFANNVTHGYQYSLPGQSNSIFSYFLNNEPNAHVEDQRAAFGSIDKISGSDYVLAHDATNTLILSHNVFAGDTNFVTVTTPLTNTLWPHMRVGGSNGQTIHVLSLTVPSDTTLPKSTFEGIDGALVYSRSLNAGQTWDKQKVLLPGIDYTHYKSFYPNNYNIDAKGNTIAFVAGGITNDLFLMKSLDNGNTWTKTVILPFAIPAFTDQITDINGDNVADTLQTNDGSIAMYIDDNGMVHVFYGNMRMLNNDSTDGEITYFPGTAGIMYWNESYGTTLPDFLAGIPDRNGNNTLDIGDDLFMYRLSLTSMPVVTRDNNGNVYLIYASIADNTLLDTRSYRHLFIVKSSDNGHSWYGTYEATPFDDFTEYVYPTTAATIENNMLHLVYQRDAEPGTAVFPVNNNPHIYAQNDLVYLRIDVTDQVDVPGLFPNPLLTTDAKELNANTTNITVYPNPASGFAQLTFTLTDAANISASLVNVMGQKVAAINGGNFAPGTHTVNLDINGLATGVYFVNLNTGNGMVTEKLIVR
ncbi:MAG: T9SS type A sorting domain-containing protein [Sphingobacteriales bacterium JAD_PAG50586_3]|nr:MAG: T9SS type A sorting domain-containing protein [Sphingobacteriales bacterium JAD_PAG50586_3]